jgi:hypothetical protein
VTSGRYHRVGGPGVWYASSSQTGSWAELFRHHEPGGVSPLEVIRRIGRARVKALKVLDPCDESVRNTFGVSQEQLTGDDLARCQEIARRAHAAGYEGILAPNGRIEGTGNAGSFRFRDGDSGYSRGVTVSRWLVVGRG